MGGACVGSCLGGVVVAAARHVDGSLTPEVAVNELKNNIGIRELLYATQSSIELPNEW